MTTSTVPSHSSVEDRQAIGERARENTPLSSQADWGPALGRPDPVELLSVIAPVSRLTVIFNAGKTLVTMNVTLSVYPSGPPLIGVPHKDSRTEVVPIGMPPVPSVRFQTLLGPASP